MGSASRIDDERRRRGQAASAAGASRNGFSSHNGRAGMGAEKGSSGGGYGWRRQRGGSEAEDGGVEADDMTMRFVGFMVRGAGETLANGLYLPCPSATEAAEAAEADATAGEASDVQMKSGAPIFAQGLGYTMSR